MAGERRLILMGGVGLALIAVAALSDFLTGSFWERHTLLASLLANVLVLAVTVIVVNELLDRRERRRWNLLAQSVLFALLQSARATWTGFYELLELGEFNSGALEPLVDAAETSRDTPRVSHAVRDMLAEPERRVRLQRMCVGLRDHAADVIAKWAPVMVGAGPYAEVLDRHVELSSRLEWLSNVLAHNEPRERATPRERRFLVSSVATERADELGNDEWLHDQILAVITLATELDYDAREHAYSLVPLSWWDERTAGLAENEHAAVQPG